MIIGLLPTNFTFWVDLNEVLCSLFNGQGDQVDFFCFLALKQYRLFSSMDFMQMSFTRKFKAHLVNQGNPRFMYHSRILPTNYMKYNKPIQVSSTNTFNVLYILLISVLNTIADHLLST